MKSHQRSWTLALLGLLALTSLLGCPQATVKTKSTWPSQPKLLLLRGIRSNMTVDEVKKRVCEQWALGKCEGWNYYQTRTFAQQRMKIFRYKDPYSPYRSSYYFYFSHHGLIRIHAYHNMNHKGEKKKLVRRYKRWFKKPSTSYSSRFSGERYAWGRKNKRHPQIRLHINGLRAVAHHHIVPRYWMDFVEPMRPVASKDNTSASLWKEVPREVRLEVLEMFGLFSHRFKTGSFWYTMNRSAKTGWLPRRKPAACKYRPTGVGFQFNAPWRYLKVNPPRQLKLEYRLSWKYWELRPKDSLFPKEKKKQEKSGDKTAKTPAKVGSRVVLPTGILLASAGKHPVFRVAKADLKKKKKGRQGTSTTHPTSKPRKVTKKPPPRKLTRKQRLQLRKKRLMKQYLRRRAILRKLRRKSILSILGRRRRKTGILGVLKSSSWKGSSVWSRRKRYKFSKSLRGIGSVRGSTYRYRRKYRGFGSGGGGGGAVGRIGGFGRGRRGRSYGFGRGFGKRYGRGRYSSSVNSWIRMEARGCGYVFRVEARRQSVGELELSSIRVRRQKTN